MSTFNIVLLPQLPPELNARILQLAAGSRPLQLLKSLRRVSKSVSVTSSDCFVFEWLRVLEARLVAQRAALSRRWDQHPSPKEEQTLTQIFSLIDKTNDSLALIKKQIQEKKAARDQVLAQTDLDKLPPAALDSIMKLSSFGLELQSLRDLSTRLKETEEKLEGPKRGNYPEDWDEDDPLRIPRMPGRPARPYDPLNPGGWGTREPDPDHMAPPDWERDRLPPPFPSPLSTDPFNPLGPPMGPFGGPGPGGLGRGGRGRGGGGPNPFNPHVPHFGGPRFL